VETIGSKRSYALTWCTPNNDDDDDVATIEAVPRYPHNCWLEQVCHDSSSSAGDLWYRVTLRPDDDGDEE